MRWDIFCRVIDNFGDIGVAWRLSRDLSARGHAVRLWLDDPAALTWMAPGGAAGVEVRHWTPSAPLPVPGDVVIEAFGCEPPAAFVAAMAGLPQPPVWINLEYLSAESYVERSHGLPSPQLAGPGRGLTKWFFYPGFSDRTGGLLREPGLLAERAAFDRAAWLAAHGVAPSPGERLVSLFCYDSAPVHSLFEALAAAQGAPALLLLSPGAAQALAQGAVLPPGLRTLALPWLTQPDHDRLLWACDLNFVRGEDSFVRAIWAGKPFVWQIYPQHDGAHAAKLDAFLALFTRAATSVDASTAVVTPLIRLMRAWNRLETAPLLLPEASLWQRACAAWRDELTARTDLTTRLLGLVAEKQLAGC